MRSRLAPLSVGLVLFAVAASARASMTYPGLVPQDLGVACPAPSCTLCHRDNNGGTGTVVTPFGRALMMAYGLTGSSNAASLQSALRMAEAQGLDANGDGVPDIEALKACKDPNVAQPSSSDGGAVTTTVSPPADPVPEYGCALGRVPIRRDGWAGAIATALAMLAWRRGIGPGRARRRGQGATDE